MSLYGTLFVEVADGPPTRYELDSQKIHIGRGPENEVVLIDLKVSRQHALLLCSASGVSLEDLGSANGFKHNKKRVRQAALQSGDTVMIGATQLHYYGPETDLQDEQTALTSLGDGLEQTVTDHNTPKLVISRPSGTRSFLLTKDRVTIGRSSKADIVIDHINVSRVHAVIQMGSNGYLLSDNKSRNGTLVSGAAITQVQLSSGLNFEIGDAQFSYQAPFEQDELSLVATAVAARPGGAPKKPPIERAAERGVVAPQAVPKRAPTRSVASGRQPVIVVPGFMGSTLVKDGELLWPAVKKFLKKPEFLKLPETLDLKAEHLVSEVVVIPGLVKLDAYNRLAQYLEQGLLYEENKNLFSFTYDWRRDLRHAARELGESIAKWEEQADLSHGKFVIIAHSAGGLVARYYVERMGGRHHVDRLILMGSPNRGTLKTFAGMLGKLLPFGARKERIRDVMATFPAAYQLLPSEPQVFDNRGNRIDLYSDLDWVPQEVHPLLEDSRSFLEELGTRSRVPVVSIFGYGQKTICRIRVKRDKRGRFTSPVFEEDDKGDGTVDQTSAILEGSEIHPVKQHHGALYTDNDVKMRLRLELLGHP